MTTAEKRTELKEICLSVSVDDCCTEACPLKDSCFLSKTSWIPEDAKLPDSDVEIIYNDYVNDYVKRNQRIAELKRVYAAYQEQKEGHNAPHTLHT